MKKVLYPLVCLFMMTGTVSASHVAGNAIRYEFNGTDYTVYVRIYRACERGAAGMVSTTIFRLNSQSLGIDTSYTLSLVSNVKKVAYCNDTSACDDPSLQHKPDMQVYTYVGSFSPPGIANDWILSHYMGSMNYSVTNLATKGSTYVYTTMNNMSFTNSNPYLPTTPVRVRYDSLQTFPFPIYDSDGDSIVVEPIASLGLAGVYHKYTPGYSDSLQLGSNGIYTFDNTNKTVSFKCSMLGSHFLAYKIKEYRSGILIDSLVDNYEVIFLPSNYILNKLTPPVVVSTNTSTSYAQRFACAGKSDNVQLSFMDSVATDSIYIAIDTPQIPGWNFQYTTTPGLGAGSCSISWTAPANLNPQTLRNFVIKVKAYNNDCPHTEGNYIIMVRTRDCNADSVWPGDANYDKRVDIADVLMVGVNYNQTGTTRTNASNNWVAQYSLDWGTTMPNKPDDIKHSDCNGDGVINANDLTAIATNWSKTHAKPGGSRNKTTGVPDLYYDVSNILFVAGQHAQVPIMLGNTSNNMNDIYGVGGVSRVGVTGSAPLVPAVVSGSGWIGTSSNTFDFDHNTTNGIINWAICATDHQNRSGNGQIGILDFEVPSTAKAGDVINLELPYTILIDKEGKQITNYNALDTVAYVFAGVGVEEVQASLQGVSIVPNPSANTAVLNLYSNTAQPVSVQITDMTGRVLWQQVENIPALQTSISLPASKLSSGIYVVTVHAADGSSQTLKWVKQ